MQEVTTTALISQGTQLGLFFERRIGDSLELNRDMFSMFVVEEDFAPVISQLLQK
jgi:hypothetical protein